jgi:hypothetical protein
MQLQQINKKKDKCKKIENINIILHLFINKLERDDILPELISKS